MDYKVGEKLKRIRKARKLTTTELSNLCGIHQTTISSIENGKHNSPGIETIEKLARILRVSPLYFFEQRVVTPFDLFDNLPQELVDFLLHEESIPYLMVSKDAFEGGISSETLEQLLNLIRNTAGKAVPQEGKKTALQNEENDVGGC